MNLIMDQVEMKWSNQNQNRKHIQNLYNLPGRMTLIRLVTECYTTAKFTKARLPIMHTVRTHIHKVGN